MPEDAARALRDAYVALDRAEEHVAGHDDPLVPMYTEFASELTQAALDRLETDEGDP